MTILVKKVFISSKPTFVCLLCPPLCGPFSIQESAAGGLSYKVKKIRQSSCLTESKIPVKQPNCRIFPLYSICLHILIKLHRDPPAHQSMPDDLPCFQRPFHIDDPLVLRTAECQCYAVELLNKLAVHEDIDQA